ncbi:MAG: hypothetical protein Q9220_001213 [cf. Caloplaca sp. 1 TL-2023]
MEDDLLAWVEDCELDVFISNATDLDLEKPGSRLNDKSINGVHDKRSLDELTAFKLISLRTSLYFDEQVNALIILESQSSLDEIEQCLQYLNIDVEAYAFGSAHSKSNSQDSQNQPVLAPDRDVIWSGAVDTSRRPMIFMGGENIALALGTFRKTESGEFKSHKDPLLVDGFPASTNILEALGTDLGFRGIRPQLTVQRLDRINKASPLLVPEQVVRSKPQHPLPAFPAISVRVRYFKSGAFTGGQSVIASLDIETSPFQDDQVQLMDVNMRLSEGVVEDLCTGTACKLPMTCQPRDSVVFLFRLVPNDDRTPGLNSELRSESLDVSINARILLSNLCRPSIHMKWKTIVDFPTVLNPNYGGPSQRMQRSQRPASLLTTPSGETSNSASQGPDGGLGEPKIGGQQQQATAIPNLGITLTLTGPKEVHVGQPFTWDVFLVNRSDKSRKLAIVVIPKRKAGEHKSHMSRTSMSAVAVGQRRDIDHADAVMDANRLYAMQKSNRKDAAQIVCLSTDVRLGNLNPGFCHNTELKFLPLVKGILHIEAVRIVDIATNESVDIRDLPEIVAEERMFDEKES